MAPLWTVFDHVVRGLALVTRHQWTGILEPNFYAAKDHAFRHIALDFIKLYNSDAVFDMSVAFFRKIKATDSLRFQFAVCAEQI